MTSPLFAPQDRALPQINQELLLQNSNEFPARAGRSLLKFLIIDDEAFNLFAMDAMLRNLKIQNIEQSFNGKHALEMLAEKQYDFDVILTDYHMPEMDGIKFAQEVRLMQERGIIKVALEIILVSGHHLPQEFDRFIIGGESRPLFDERLLKPFSRDQLKETLLSRSII